MSEEMSIPWIMERIASTDPSRLAGVNAVVLFDLSGAGGGKWTVQIVNGKPTVTQGETATPNATISMTAADFIAMSSGKLNAVNAFMQGKIKVSGDMGLIMRLQSILS